MPPVRKPFGEVPPATTISPPGRFGDGPVYVRVNRELAGRRWTQTGYRIEINDRRCAYDHWHDYVTAENSHNAFIYARNIVKRGIEPRALTVVRLATTD